MENTEKFIKMILFNRNVGFYLLVTIENHEKSPIKQNKNVERLSINQQNHEKL